MVPMTFTSTFVSSISPHGWIKTRRPVRCRPPVCCERRPMPDPSPGAPSIAHIALSNTPQATHGGVLRAAILVSGGGRSLLNLCEHVESRTLRGVSVCGVISSKAKAGANDIASQRGLPLAVVVRKDYSDSDTHSEAVTAALVGFKPHVIVMAGWMHFYRIPQQYAGRVINIHPSLIPAFCGKGFYGMRVHRAVVEFGAKVTGCTVHFADNEYDHGPIILQRAVEVEDDDEAEDVARRVFEAEKQALPAALKLLAEGRLYVDGRVVRVRARSSTPP